MSETSADKTSIKYTSDGKKVVVIGQLNAQESIVQEIFVSGDAEIPSGENFVVKSLHDKPVVSWKEKKTKEIEDNYKAAQRRSEQEYRKASDRLTMAREKARAVADALFAFVDNAEDEQLQTLRSFLSGEITHYAVPKCWSPEIVEAFDDKMFDMDRFHGIRFNGTKLISLMGKSDGSLDYRLNLYRDGSGSWDEIIPCRSYEDAVAIMQKHFDVMCDEYVQGKRRSIELVKWEAINGVVATKEARSKYEAGVAKSHAEKIAKLEAQLNELKATHPHK